jgi:hypothetical protein
MVQTRSQAKLARPLVAPFVFDFDESSAAWKANKKRMGNGTYKYICGAPTKNNTLCQRTPLANHCHCAQHQSF